MSLTRILPSMIDSTAASDGDALVFSAANARFEFGAVEDAELQQRVSNAENTIVSISSNAVTTGKSIAMSIVFG